MTWWDLTHADLVAGLRALLESKPLPPPRVIYPTPDGRERTRLGRASQGTATAGDNEPSVGVEASREEPVAVSHSPWGTW